MRGLLFLDCSCKLDLSLIVFRLHILDCPTSASKGASDPIPYSSCLVLAYIVAAQTFTAMQRRTVMPAPAPLMPSFHINLTFQLIRKNDGHHLHRRPSLHINRNRRECRDLIITLFVPTVPESPLLSPRLFSHAARYALQHSITKFFACLTIHSAFSTLPRSATHTTSDLSLILPTRSACSWHVCSDQAAIRPLQEVAVRATRETGINLDAHSRDGQWSVTKVVNGYKVVTRRMADG